MLVHFALCNQWENCLNSTGAEIRLLHKVPQLLEALPCGPGIEAQATLFIGKACDDSPPCNASSCMEGLLENMTQNP